MAKQKSGARSLPPQVAAEVRRVVAPRVTETGLYLEDIKLTSDGGRPVVRIVLDLPEDAVGALGSDRLDDAARVISQALDADDVVPGAYNLEVTSPGVSRPLTTARHFKRARGRIVETERKTGAPIRGRLLDVVPDSEATDASEAGADAVILVFDNGTRLPLGEVKKGKVKVELKRIDEVPLTDLSANNDATDSDATDNDATDND